MKNFADPGDAGSQAISRARHLSAVSPLVLIVEDHEDTRFLLRHLLEMRGYCVIEAKDGEDAVRQAVTLTPDLVLMDRSLPRMDGLSAMRRIHERDELQVVPVVFLSGHAHPADREGRRLEAAACECYRVIKAEFDRYLNLCPNSAPPRALHAGRAG